MQGQLIESGLPPMAWRMIDPYAGQKEAVAALSTQEGGVMLVGGVGVGKTHLLARTGWHLIHGQERRGQSPVRYWNWPELLEAAKGTFDGNGTNPISRALEQPWLILDDLGAERPTDFALDALARVVEYRYRNELPLLAATNVEPHRWKVRFGERVASRMRGMLRTVYVSGEDRRGAPQRASLFAA